MSQNNSTKVQYGHWGEVNYHQNPADRNTHQQIRDLEQAVSQSDFFPASGEGIEVIGAFIGHQGFFVFRRDLNLLHAFSHYLQMAVENTCNSCSACREGGKLLYQKLVELQNANKNKDVDALDAEEILLLAKTVIRESQCGIGKYSAYALAKFIEFFPEEFQQQVTSFPHLMIGHYYHHVTAPCIENCPAHLDIPKYLSAIRSKDFSALSSIIAQDHPLLSNCGDVCAGLCEAGCTRKRIDYSLSIRRLKERVLQDSMAKLPPHPWKYTTQQVVDKNKNQKVAILGASATALASSYYLLQGGLQVDLYLDRNYHEEELLERVVPYYRLGRCQLRQSLEQFVANGGRIHRWFSHGVEREAFLNFTKNYSATLMAFDQGDYSPENGQALRANLDYGPSSTSYRMHGLRFLLDYCLVGNEEARPMPSKVCVLGGSSLALHCAMAAKRGKALQVRVLFTGDESEMTAHPAEIAQALSEGVILQTHVSLLSITNSGEGKVQKVQLEYLDHSGKGQEHCLALTDFEQNFANDLHYFNTDVLVTCTQSNPWWKKIPYFSDFFRLNENGNLIVTNAAQMTDQVGVFAAGECVGGPLSLISAFAEGKKVAKQIASYVFHSQIAGEAYDEENGHALSVVGKIRQKLRHIYPGEDVYRWQGHQCLGANHHLSMSAGSLMEFEVQAEAQRCLRCYEISLLVTTG